MCRKTSLVLIFLITLIGCSSPQKEIEIFDFNVELRHFYGAEGYMLHYFVNQDSIKLRHDCDFANCKDSLIYETKISYQNTQDLYRFLVESNYDTLSNSYIEEGFDGRYTFIKINGDSIPSKSIRMERYRHDLIEMLIDKVDLSIPEIKFRLYRHKYQEEEESN